MLKNTSEFKEFAGYVDDSGGNVRYTNTKGNFQSELKGLPELENQGEWVPDPAFQLAHQFRNKHGGELTVDLVNSLLSDLNKIWKDRERK